MVLSLTVEGFLKLNKGNGKKIIQILGERFLKNIFIGNGIYIMGKEELQKVGR